MLRYNKNTQALEFDQEAYENYINQRLEKDNHWNRTQLTLIVQTMVDAIDGILEIYKFYPGSAIKLLKSLSQINLHEEDKDKYLLNKIIDWQDNKDYPWALSELGEQMPIIYQICLGDLDKLNLRCLQSSRINAQQIRATHEIVEDLLKLTIQSIKESEIYQNAKKQNCLYFRKRFFIENFSKEDYAPLYESNTLARIVFSEKPKRKSREDSATTSRQSIPKKLRIG